MRRLAAAVLALGCSAGASGQEPEPQAGPDLEFLEYLGAWAEEDDEWLAIEEWQRENGDTAGEGPEGSESERDDDDESE